jgi:O-antigen/teichoic acid export membrane protein
MLFKVAKMTFLQGLNTLVPYLTIPLIIRRVGIEGYGLIGVSIATIQYIQLIVDHGYTLNASRSISQKNELDLTSEIFWNLFFSKIILFISCSAFFELISPFLKIDELTIDLVRIGYMIVIGQILTPTWLYIGKDKGNTLLILSLLPKVIVLPLFFIFLHDSSNVKLAMFFQSITFLFTGIITFYIPLKLKWIKFKNPELIKMIIYYKNSWPLFISALSGTLVSSSTPIILNITSGAHFVGIFIAADKIRQAAQSVLAPISLVVYPKINRIFSINKVEALKLISKISYLMLIFSSILGIFIAFFSSYLLQLIYTPELEEAKLSLQILAFAIFFTYANTVTGTYIFIPFELDKDFSKIVLITGILHTLFLFALCSLFQSIGASASVALNELIILILMIVKMSKVDINLIRSNFENSILKMIFKK